MKVLAYIALVAAWALIVAVAFTKSGGFGF